MQNERRYVKRIVTEVAIDLKIDSQITVCGNVKNINENGAFIQIKSSVSMRVNDQFEFVIKNEQGRIAGMVCISRVVPGDGIGVYFLDLDSDSKKNIQILISSGEL